MREPNVVGRLAGLAGPSLGGAVVVGVVFMALPTLADRPFREPWPIYLALILEGACLLGGTLGVVGGIAARRAGASAVGLLALVLALGASAYMLFALGLSSMRC